ncbi:DUF4148 domain-containing protein [Burkholderia sp. S171]|uniref:DUF4148 domain-containing protein n=1 Tax=Burkholderia sp. S171 TaxID=1641860 RepID=UPI00131BEA4C|nr:DUF4148 domain-containing protein [Burkholderia sp. S171]
MNIFYISVLVTALGAIAPSIVHAQPAAGDTSLSREQVKQQLKDLRAVGYQPGDWGHYPENIQAAQRQITDGKTGGSQIPHLN